MRKIGIGLLALSLIFLGGCKSQTVGNCTICGEEEKLYYVYFTVDGEEDIDETFLFCDDCKDTVSDFYEAADKLSDYDTKWKIKKYYGEVK